MKHFIKRSFTKGYIAGRAPINPEFYDTSYFRGERSTLGFGLYPEKEYSNPESSVKYKFIDVLQLIQIYVVGSKILDIGSGPGHLSYWSKKLKTKLSIFECDISKGTNHNENFKLCFADSLNYPNEFFDGVVSLDIIEHLYPENALVALKEAYRVLKIGGIIFLKTPNRRTWDDRTYIDKAHVWLGSMSEIKKALNTSGFKILRNFTRGFPWSDVFSKLFKKDLRLPWYGNAIYVIAKKNS